MSLAYKLYIKRESECTLPCLCPVFPRTFESCPAPLGPALPWPGLPCSVPTSPSTTLPSPFDSSHSLQVSTPSPTMVHACMAALKKMSSGTSQGSPNCTKAMVHLLSAVLKAAIQLPADSACAMLDILAQMAAEDGLGGFQPCHC